MVAMGNRPDCRNGGHTSNIWSIPFLHAVICSGGLQGVGPIALLGPQANLGTIILSTHCGEEQRAWSDNVAYTPTARSHLN